MIEPKRETLDLQDGAISYLEWVSRAPTLVFSHATGFNAQTYRTLLQPLADGLHIYAQDQRGHGFNSFPNEKGSAKDWAIYRDDTAGFLEALGGRPAILAGHSMGATTSLMVALQKPHLVRALVLIEPVFVPAKLSWVHFKRTIRFWEKEPDIADRAERRRDTFNSLEAIEENYRGRGAFKTWPDAVLHDYLEGGTLQDEDKIRLACEPAWEAETFRSTPFGVTGLAGKLSCPVTIIYGGLSNTCSDAEAQRFARNHEGTRRIRVDKATHFLPMEYPDVVRSEIARIARIAPRAL